MSGQAWNTTQRVLTIEITDDDLISVSPVASAVRRACGPVLNAWADRAGIHVGGDGHERHWTAPWPEDLIDYLGSGSAAALEPPACFTLHFSRVPGVRDEAIAMYGAPGDEEG